MKMLLVTYLLILGITFIFYPTGIAVAYRNDLDKHVTIVFPQRGPNTPLALRILHLRYKPLWSP